MAADASPVTWRPWAISKSVENLYSEISIPQYEPQTPNIPPYFRIKDRVTLYLLLYMETSKHISLAALLTAVLEHLIVNAQRRNISLAYSSRATVLMQGK